MTIYALPGWMLVQPLNHQSTANDKLRVGRVHQIGELHDTEMQAKIPFKEGDRVCWIDGINPNVHVLNETLLLVPLQAPLAYEPAEPVEPETDVVPEL